MMASEVKQQAVGVASVAEKLVHPLQEVRRRAAQSLEFKHKHGLISGAQVRQDPTIIHNMLGCFRYDNGPQIDASILTILSKLVESPAVAKELLHFGLQQALDHVKATRPAELHHLADAILVAMQPTAQQVAMHAVPGPASRELGFPAEPSQRPGSAAASRSHAEQPYATPHPQLGSAVSSSGRSGSASVNQRVQELMPRTSAAVPSMAFAWSPASLPQGAWAEQRLESRSQMAMASYAEHPAASSAAAGRSWPPPPQSPFTPATGQQPSSSLSAMHRTSGGGAAQLQQEARRSTGQALAEQWRAPPAAPDGLAGGMEADGMLQASRACDERDWLLAPVPCDPDDDRQMFELVTRARCLEDVRVSGPALWDLLHSVAVDFPPELVAKQHNVLATALMLLEVAPPEGELSCSAAALLLRLVRGLKRSLAAATDRELLAPAVSEPASLSAAEPEARGQVPGAAGAHEGLGLGGRLPQALPAVPEGQRSGPALVKFCASVVNVTSIAFTMASQVFGLLRNPERHFQLLPLVEELLPLLLVTRQGPLQQVSEQNLERWALLLQQLSAALMTNLSISRSEAASLLRAYLEDGVQAAPPIMNLAAANIASLLVRMLTQLPSELWDLHLVTPGVADTLAAVAKDDVICSLLPEGTRAALLPVLSRIRPDVAAALEAAAEAEQALGSADKLVNELSHLLAGTTDPAEWLQHLQRCLPVLDLPGRPDTGLLQAAVQGLAYVCSANTGAGTQRLHSSAQRMFVGLLVHWLPEVQLAVYSTLQRMLQEDPAPLPALLSARCVLEQLVVGGLSDPHVQAQAAALLLHLLQQGQPDVTQALLYWMPWACLHEDSPAASALVSSLSHCHAAQLSAPRPGAPDWPGALAAVHGLFSRHSERRLQSSLLLRRLLYSTADDALPDEPHMSDPLKVCLDAGAHDDLVLGSVNPKLGNTFSAQDVENLAAILHNPALAPELRRSAAEQLLGLAHQDPRVLDAMSTPERLELTLAAAAAALATQHQGQQAAPAPPTLLSAASGEIQLALACVNLLYVICCRSPRSRRWLVASAGGQGQPPLLPLLPLLLHPLLTARRAAARLLAAAAFLQEADKHSAWAHTWHQHCAPAPSSGTAAGLPKDPAQLLCLPEAFRSQYLMPCKVTWIKLPDASASQAQDAQLPADGQPLGAAPVKSSLIQGLAAEQRCLVHVLLHEQRLLRQAQGNPFLLLRLLDDPTPGPAPAPAPGSKPLAHPLSTAAAQACGSNVRSLSLHLRAHAAAEALLQAASHGQAAEALRAAATVAATAQGARVLASCPAWAEALAPLLATAPATGEDREMWSRLLQVVQRTLGAGVGGQGEGQGRYLMLVAGFLGQSAPPLLSAPAAARAPRQLPLALAGSSHAPGMGDQAPAGGQQVLQVTQLLLQTLTALARCCRLQLPAASCLAALRLLPLPALLHTLAAGFLDQPEAHYGCRVAALGLLLELLQGMDAGRLLAAEQAQAPDLSQALSMCLSSIITHVCHAAFGTEPHEQPWLHVGRGFRGGAALTLGLGCLQLLTQGALAPRVWAAAWSQVDPNGPFWLSHLSREPDAWLRSQAWILLARLAAPSAPEGRRMVEAGWPEAPARAAQAAADGGECCAVRAAALRFLACLLGGREDEERGSGLRGSRLSAFHPQVLLMQQQQLVEQLMGVAREDGAPAALVTAAVSVTLQGLLVDEDAMLAQLQQPGNIQWLLQRLAACSSAWHTHARSPATSAAQAAAALLHSLPALGATRTHVGTPGSADRQLLVSFPAPADLDVLDLSWGLDLSPTPWTAGDSARQAAADGKNTLACCYTTVQILGVLSGSDAVLGHGGSEVEGGGGGSRLVALQGGAVLRVKVAVQLLAALRVLLGGVEVWGQGEGEEAETWAGLELDKWRAAALHEAAAACNSALQQLGPEDVTEVAGMVACHPGAGGCPPLLVALADALSATALPLTTKTSVACLVALLLSDEGRAAALLLDDTTGSEHLSLAGSTAVGAQLCRMLVELLPDDALTITCDAEGLPLVQPLAPAGGAGDVALIVALRNTLAYSVGAKAEAATRGLPRALLHCCSVGVNLLRAAEHRASRAGAGDAGGPPQTPAPAPTPGGRHAPRSGRPDLKALLRRRVPVSAPPSASKLHSAEDQAFTALRSSAGGPSLPALPKQALQALDQRLAVCLSLLKFMAYSSSASRQHLVEAGVVEAARNLWKHLLAAQARQQGGGGGSSRPGTAAPASPARGVGSSCYSGPPASPSKRGVQVPAAGGSQCLQELLGLLTNLVVGCVDARARLTGAGGPVRQMGVGPAAAGAAASVEPSLLHVLAELLFHAPVQQSTHSLLVGLFTHLSATEDGVQLLLKLQGLQGQQQQQQQQDFLGSCLSLLRDWVAQGRAKDSSKQRHQGILQVLVNMAAFKEGQRALLQQQAVLELLSAVLDPPDGAPRPAAADCELALLLLRNLCFAPEAKAHLLAHPLLLPALMDYVERAAEAPRGAAAASSALWALIYHGEKVKAALRRLGNTSERLTVVRATCEFQLRKLGAGDEGGPGAAGQGQAGQPGSRRHWLQHALRNTCALLDAFQSTAVPSPSKASRGMATPVGEPRATPSYLGR